MTDKAANLSVTIRNQQVNATAMQAAMQILMSGGANSQRTELSISILEQLTGRRIPQLGFCPGSTADAFKYYRDELGAAVLAAQAAIRNLSGALADTNSALSDAKKTVDALLGANPDPTTPQSVDELTDAIGGLRPTTDRNALEQRVGELLDLNIVNGVLYPKGTTDLGPLRQLVQTLGLQRGSNLTAALGAAAKATNSLSDAARAGNANGLPGTVGAGDGFLLIPYRTETIERIVGSVCGDNIVEFEVTERALGINIPIPAEATGIRLFWLDRVRSDPPALKRLRALGMTPEEVGAAVTGGDAGRVTQETVDTETIGKLQDRLSDDEIIDLLSRPDTNSGINPEPTTDEIIATIKSTLKTNTGGNRNRAGTDEDAIESGQAGRGGDAAMLLFGLLDFFRTTGVTDLPEIEGLDDRCRDIVLVVRESILGIRPLFDEAQQFVRDMFGQIGLGNHAISAGVDFTSCLISFNLGLDFAISLALALPFSLQIYLAALTVMVTAFVSAVAAIRFALCIPQAVIQLLFGGVCGFKPFDFGICPPDIQNLVDRLVSLLNIAIELVTKLGGSMFSMKMDASRLIQAANSFKNLSPCALTATGLGIALGLRDTQLTPGADIASPTVGNVESPDTAPPTG